MHVWSTYNLGKNARQSKDMRFASVLTDCRACGSETWLGLKLSRLSNKYVKILLFITYQASHCMVLWASTEL